MPLYERIGDYLTPGEAAGILGVSPKTVSRWADVGLLPCITTLGGHRRFDRFVILDAAAEMGVYVPAAKEGSEAR